MRGTAWCCVVLRGAARCFVDMRCMMLVMYGIRGEKIETYKMEEHQVTVVM